VLKEKVLRNRQPSVSRDVERIVNLPVKDYAAEAAGHVDRFHRMHRRRVLDDEGEPVVLLKMQAAALLALEQEESIIVPLQPGEGKTLISFLAAGHYEQTGRLKRAKPLLAVPATLRQKTYDDLIEYGKNWNIVPPDVVSYALLSRRPYLLEDATYNILILDEGHKLKDTTSARTKRVLTSLIEHPETLVIVLTASFWGEGLHHSAHWCDACLRENTPIPLNKWKRAAWAKVLDVRVDDHEAWQHMVDMEPLRRRFAPRSLGRDGCRAAFAKRVACAPGIVMGEPDDRVSSALILGVEENFPINEDCLKAINAALGDGVRPDGEVLPDPPRQWQCARNLSAGFYYRWIWPDGRPDLEWLDARRRWYSAVREELSGEHEKGYDTEALVVKRVRAGKADPKLAMLHERWRREDDRLDGDPPKEAVWLDKRMPIKLVRYARRMGGPVILWVESIAMQEALRKTGTTVYRGTELPPKKPEHDVSVMSWRSHGEGKNLHGWSLGLIAEPPGGPTVWEQLLAREHRRGQRADEVKFITLAHTKALVDRLKLAVQLAHNLAVQTGFRQRLAYCDKVEAKLLLKKER
jgi:hypothetical protein